MCNGEYYQHVTQYVFLASPIIAKYDFNTKYSNCRPIENRSRLMETESNLNFDAFPAEVGAVQIGHSSNQTKSDEIYQAFPSFPSF